MIHYNYVAFDTAEDLELLTGLTHAELWEAGFNLDDMDGGIRVDHDLSEDDFGTFGYFLDSRMDTYCVGYTKVFYKGYYYFTIHHA